MTDVPDKLPVSETIARVQQRRAQRPSCSQHPDYRLDDAGMCSRCHEETRREELTHVAARDGEHHARVAQQMCDREFPVRFRHAVADHPEVMAWIRQTREDLAGAESLFLLGSTGVGKTHQAYGALRAALQQPQRLTWRAMTAADLVASLRPSEGVDTEQQLQKYRNVDLLLIDDFGALKTSEWVEEITYRLIDGRYTHCKPTIFTSNLPPKDLAERVGDRVASRIAEICPTRVTLTGTDRRRTGP